MTAMSAPRSASNAPAEPVPPHSPETAAPLLGGSTVEVRLPGSAWTYRSRELLKAIGLRWDPATHAWHGRVTASDRTALALDSAARVTRNAPLESFAVPNGEQREDGVGMPDSPRPPEPPRGPRPTPTKGVGALPRRQDYSRTRAESHTLYHPAAAGEDADASESLDLDTEDPAGPRRFTAWETTSGLPDDSREADERQEERYLRDLRARVKQARAVIAATTGLAEILASNPRKAAMFHARFGVIGEPLRKGVNTGNQDNRTLASIE